MVRQGGACLTHVPMADPFQEYILPHVSALCFCVLSCLRAETSVPPMLQGAFDIPQRPEMETRHSGNKWVLGSLLSPADPPVAVTDACLGKIAALAQDAGKSQRGENRASRVEMVTVNHTLWFFLTCFVVYKGFVIYETVLGEMT